MRAALCRTYGGPEGVHVEEVPRPDLGPGSVRVEVNAAAVNFPDVLIVAGEYQLKVPPPFIPGSEFAGLVTEVAEDVATLAPGERVFGTSLVGAFAEEIVVNAKTVTRTPSSVGDRDAAAFGVAHRTAYHVLKSIARLQPGDEVVVLGAGGGVGLASVQIATLLGGRVTAVASTDEKLDVARSLGAVAAVNHTNCELREALRELAPSGVGVVVDPVGGRLSEPALRSLRWGGRFVTVGYASGEIPMIPLNLVLLKGVEVLGFQFLDFATHAPGELAKNEAELMQLLASGRAHPHIGARFSLGEAGAALRLVADGRAVGKVILDVRR